MIATRSSLSRCAVSRPAPTHKQLSASSTACWMWLESLGTDIAVFKGLAIASRWYDRPELRPAADIDIFVNPEHLSRLGPLADALATGPASGAVVEHMVEHDRTFEYTLTVDGVDVDLHLDPMNLAVPSLQRDLIWQRTELLPIAGGPTVRALDLELSLIQALIHLLRDNFADLLHINDVRLMIDEDPDWDFIASFAAAEGWTDIIRFSLGYVCDVLGVPSPLPRDLSRTSRALIGLAWPERIRLRGRDSVVRSQRRQTLASYLIAGRRTEVTRALLHRVFPPRVVIDDRYPGCNCPYPVALIRWRLVQRARLKRARSHPRQEVPHAAV